MSDFADFAVDYARTQMMVRFSNAAFKIVPTTGATTLITDADYPTTTVRGCVYLDGTFYVMDAFGTIYGSDIDDCTSWNALNFISAEFDPDPGVFLGKVGSYIVAFGTQTTQLFWDAANATGSPLSAVQNGVFNVGCAHAYSVQPMEDSLIWMAQRKAQGTGYLLGRFVAILTKGSTDYKTISTPDVDRVLNADDLATVHSYTSAENGHYFYNLELGTSGLTLTYDITTGLWHQWTRGTSAAVTLTSLTQSSGTATATKAGHGFSDGDEVTIAGADQSGYNKTVNVTVVDSSTFTYPVASATVSPATGTITATGSTQGPFNMVAACAYGGNTIFQDVQNGYIWEMLTSNQQDNSVSIDFKARTARRDYGVIYRKFPFMLTYIGNVSTSTDTGLLRYTDDDYATYSNYRHFDLTDTYSNLHRFGNYRRRAWEWRYTGTNAHFIEALEEELKQGGV